MTIKDVIMETQKQDVLKTFAYFYGTIHLEKVKKIYEKLKESNVKPNETNMIFFIRVLEENEQGDDVVVGEFDTENTNLFFDVCGENDSYEGLFSLADSEFDELLGYDVHAETLKKFSFSQIIAHLLWEIDW